MGNYGNTQKFKKLISIHDSKRYSNQRKTKFT